jgi:hypothetical protein
VCHFLDIRYKLNSVREKSRNSPKFCASTKLKLEKAWLPGHSFAPPTSSLCGRNTWIPGRRIPAQSFCHRLEEDTGENTLTRINEKP